MSKKVIITGSTGMVGSIVLQLCLESNDVSEIIALVRKPTKIQHLKYKEVIVTDFYVMKIRPHYLMMLQ